MRNSANIRKANRQAIYRLLLSGNCYTKQQVAAEVGLSQATCNTLLNEMAAQGLVMEDSRLFGDVGRSSVLYKIREDHESYLAIHFMVEKQKKYAETIVFSATGSIQFQEKSTYDCLDYKQVEQMIEKILSGTAHIAQIIVGTPSIADHGIIRHSDIPELEGVPMIQNLEQRFGIPVSMENDMHHKAYGYCKKRDHAQDVVTLAYFPSHILPGTVTIHQGMIIRGANSFAGMTGFLPYGVSREEQLALLKPDTCTPFISKAICSIITLLNPGTVVLTGDLISQAVLDEVREICQSFLPREYMPQLLVVDSFDEYYYEGMFQLAVDRKDF